MGEDWKRIKLPQHIILLVLSKRQVSCSHGENIFKWYFQSQLSEGGTCTDGTKLQPTLIFHGGFRKRCCAYLLSVINASFYDFRWRWQKPKVVPLFYQEGSRKACLDLWISFTMPGGFGMCDMVFQTPPLARLPDTMLPRNESDETSSALRLLTL